MSEPVVCPRCGQRGDERPGFTLRPYPNLEAVFVPVGDEHDHALVGDRLPQQLLCKSCGWSRPAFPGEIQVRKAKPDE